MAEDQGQNGGPSNGFIGLDELMNSGTAAATVKMWRWSRLVTGTNHLPSPASRHERMRIKRWHSSASWWWSPKEASYVELVVVLAVMRRKKASPFSSRGPQLPVTYRNGMWPGFAVGLRPGGLRPGKFFSFF
jgi:hypothetical protein